MEIEIIKWLQSFKNKTFDIIFYSFSFFASVIFLIVLFIIFLLLKKKKFGIYLLFCGAFNIIIIELLKYVIKRPRPYEISEQIESNIGSFGNSFPSLHICIATTICVFGLYLFLSKNWDKWPNISAFVLCLIYLSMVGLSRMYFGQHFLSDIVGGFFITAFLCAFELNFFEYFSNKTKK